jgi:predicted acetyltransferase
MCAAKTVRIQLAEQDKKTSMTDPYPMRPIRREEFEAFRYVTMHAFHLGTRAPERMAIFERQFDFERSLCAFDPAAPSAASDSASDSAPLAREGDIVGTAGAFSFQMTVPGSVIPVAGVSFVSVLPTYRRRGVARALMTRQLSDIAARGEEPVAALWATEAPLYGRYGYGPAAWVTWLKVGRGEGALTTPADPSISLRLVSPAQAAADLAKVYDSVLPAQPGFFARDDAWWDHILADIEAERGGAGPLRCLLASDSAGPRGYALYSARQGWDEAELLPDSKISIRELIARDPLASAALWRDLLSRDLVTEVSAPNRPADDPLLFQLADLRRARPKTSDGIWVRIVDVPRALCGRAYSCPVDVVLEVTDSLLPVNAGRWRLRAAGYQRDDVTCARTDDPADVALDVRELAAAYLGGTRLGALAAAGLVTELRAGALGLLSTAMSWDPSPWCPVIF